MDFAQYTKPLKYLSIIPVVVGILTFIEGFLPYKTIETRVISKESSYRIKTSSTTYTINFEGINDQFTEDIYSKLREGDNVIIKATYFNKEIRELIKLPENDLLINSTSEPYFLYAFATVFLLSGLVWFKSGTLKNKHAMYLAFIILFSIIQASRML